MIMENKEMGEHSRKTRNNDNEEERPFKKAKYVWQLKGKYHLKENYKQSNGSDMKEGSSKDIVEEEAMNNDVNTNNITLISKNCNKCCLDTLLARSNAILESEDSSDLDISSNNIDRSIYDEIPVTLVKPNPKNQEDYLLQKWQARQVAKCFVDNTINRILEQWKLAPVDAADFVENCDNDGHVEDEGILMAIQSHGLQSGTHYPNISCRGLGEASHSEEYPMTFLQSSCLEESALDNYENVYHERKKTAEQEMMCDSDPEKLDTFEMTDQMDFLSAAVSVAIQKKGLSSYSYG